MFSRVAVSLRFCFSLIFVMHSQLKNETEVFVAHRANFQSTSSLQVLLQLKTFGPFSKKIKNFAKIYQFFLCARVSELLR